MSRATTSCANCRDLDSPPLTTRSWMRGGGESMQTLPVCARCIEAMKRVDRGRREALIASGAILPLSARPRLGLLPAEREAFERAAREPRWALAS